MGRLGSSIAAGFTNDYNPFCEIDATFNFLNKKIQLLHQLLLSMINVDSNQ